MFLVEFAMPNLSSELRNSLIPFRVGDLDDHKRGLIPLVD
jgi:hypothetical protein